MIRMLIQLALKFEVVIWYYIFPFRNMHMKLDNNSIKFRSLSLQSSLFLFRNFRLSNYYIRQMLKNQANRHHFHSTKSLSKFKLEGTNKLQQLMPLLRVNQGNSFSITTNVANYSSNKQGNKMEDDYIKRIKYLQAQLKKKLIDDTVLRNLFKVKCPPQITHLDIYLEMRKLEQTLNIQLEIQKKLKDKVLQLQNLVLKQEQEHIKYIEMLGESIEEKQMQWKSQKLRIQLENKTILEGNQNCKFLLQQIKKKYEQLNKKYKNLSDQLQIQKSAKNLEILQQKEQFQNILAQYIEEIKAYKHEINALRKELKELKNQKQKEEAQKYKILAQLQQIKDEKQKVELRIRETQQICNDYAYQNKIQKQKHIQQLQRISIENTSKLQHMKDQYKQQIRLLEQKQSEFTLKLQSNQKLFAGYETKLALISQQKLKLQDASRGFVQKQKDLQKELANLQKKNVKLSIQLMQIRCEKDQQSKVFAKERLQMQDKQNIIRNLQSKRMTSHSKNSFELKSQIQKKYFRS